MAEDDRAEDRPTDGEPFVVFMPSGRRGRVPTGTTLLEAARAVGADVDSVCGGRSICGRCQVVVAEGVFAKHGIDSRAAHASPASESERGYADRRGLAADRRLACQARVLDNLVVDVPADSQVHKQVIRKRPEVRAIAVDPVIKLHYIEVAEPRLDDPASDLRRLDEALRRQWGLDPASHTLGVAQGVQAALRAGGGGRRRSRCATPPRCSPFGPGFGTRPTASPSTWGRRPSPPT